MAFDDAALERALRAETKHGLTLYCNGETLTALGYEWMAITPGGIVRQEDGDTGERLYRRGYRPREDTDSEATLRKWRHLEAMSWCDWDAPEE